MDIDQLLETVKKSYPKVDGTEKIKGLESEVEVLWDEWGIPHVFAASLDDAFFVEGYIHAKYRLWQMELYKRAFSGRLSELLGEATLDKDKHVRTIGFHRLARKWAKKIESEPESDACRYLSIYCKGVNAGVADSRGTLPVEFDLLGLEPEPWKIENILLVVYMLDWQESLWNSNMAILREYLIQKHGKEKADQIFPLFQGASLESHPGSNSWALSPEKSETGGVILCSDPHLALNLPCIWFEIHLHCPELNVIGVSVPGAPGVIIGHNEHVGWGITNVQADTQDLFRIEVNPGNEQQYKYNGEWVDFEVIREPIMVKDARDPLDYEVLWTKFGPVIEYFEKFDTVVKLEVPGTFALRWTGHDVDPTGSIHAFLKLNQATNWQEFRKALETKCTTPHNIIYGDVNGNIGHQHAGVIPIRKKGNGVLINPGTSEDWNWKGLSSFEKLRSIYNPKINFVYTANLNEEKIHNGILIAMDSVGVHRQARIKSILESKERFSLKECQAQQSDVFSREAQEFLPMLLDKLKISDLKGIDGQVLDFLETWDYQLTTKSTAAVIYKVWCYEAIVGILEPFFDNDFLEIYTEGYTFSLARLFKMFEGNEEHLGTILKNALLKTISYLKENISRDCTKWLWGKIHKLTLVHPFSLAEPEAKILNVGPFKVGGDLNTLNNGHCVPAKDFKMTAGASYRHVLDFTNWDNCVAVIPGGQSGLPFHKHYNDLIKLWVKGKYHPMLFTRDAILKHLEGKLELKPS